MLEVGRNYFVWQELKMGLWMARGKLQEVNEATGRAGVLESKLLAAPALTGLRMDGRSTAQRLEELEQLRKSGVVTDEECQKKRKDIIDRMWRCGDGCLRPSPLPVSERFLIALVASVLNPMVLPLRKWRRRSSRNRTRPVALASRASAPRAAGLAGDGRESALHPCRGA